MDERIKLQAYLALANAFKTIDAFQIPSTEPNMTGHYDKLKECLLERYGKDIDPVELNKLILED